MEIIICIFLGGFVVASGLFFTFFTKHDFKKMRNDR